LLDNRFDRKYEYDHAARVIKALSGAEARGEPATTNRPYKQTTAYDTFDHITTRSTLHWSRTLGFGSSDSYVNNRRNGWTYDANGSLLNLPARQYTYDAAGRMKALSWTGGGFLNQFFDGDGQRVKSSEPNIANYYVRSTVLGGQVITQLNSAGVREWGFIYVAGELFARQSENGAVALLHREPSGVSVRATSQAGVSVDWVELDPLGSEVYAWDPYLSDPQFAGGRGEGGPIYPGYGNVGLPSTGCTLDGVYLSCDLAQRVGETNAAIVGPRKTTRYNDTTKRYEFFKAYADGYSGYLPADAQYVGGGVARRFTHFDYTSVTADGSTSGKWHPVFVTYELNAEPQKTEPKPNCTFPTYDQLSTAQQGLLDAGAYGALSDDAQRANFLNQTGALAKAGINLGRAALQDGGILTDRLLFAPGPSLGTFRASIETAIASGGFIKDTPVASKHPGMSDFGARQNRTFNALQVGFGDNGAFVDIDRGNPSGGLAGLIVHGAEVLTPGKTDPFAVGKKLGSKVTGYTCK
jgi:hypothetical protein